MFSVTIPTKTYLAKYIHGRYGKPVIIDHRTVIGCMMLSFLDKKIYQDTPTIWRNLRFEKFTEKVEMVLPAHRAYNYHTGLNIGKDKAIVINRYFETQFEEDLHRYCFSYVNPVLRDRIYKGKGGCGYEKAITEFAEMYGIELDVDISFECLKKSEYRFRKKIGKMHSVNVPQKQPVPMLFA
jgi:hypothetical protein